MLRYLATLGGQSICLEDAPDVQPDRQQIVDVAAPICRAAWFDDASAPAWRGPP